jgi:hypothetical protein
MLLPDCHNLLPKNELPYSASPKYKKELPLQVAPFMNQTQNKIVLFTNGYYFDFNPAIDGMLLLRTICMTITTIF